MSEYLEEMEVRICKCVSECMGGCVSMKLWEGKDKWVYKYVSKCMNVWELFEWRK